MRRWRFPADKPSSTIARCELARRNGPVFAAALVLCATSEIAGLDAGIRGWPSSHAA